ncbi:hypothetical protein GQ53DRAFT_866227 [Thozetella sp. PMI_491]|nr:hypothetical protein GQ53DRAFT_866227 [Thozetella sp. PMI_491]
MVSYRLVAFAGLAAALPLNINLGAYSPALVVGDGEISFGGKQDVSNLMSALEGAAVNAAAGATNGAAAAGAVAAPAAAAPAVAAAAAQPEAVSAASADPTLSQQAQQITALQGMGKEIAPREGETVAKRDLTGFDRALKFAEVALTKGPKVQLGTGGEGSGVGIIVENSPAAAGAARAKRDADEAAAPRRRAKVTTMYVRRGVPASLQSPSELQLRDVAAALPAVPAAASFSRRDAIDAVNLNVDGNEGVTMTFVETVEDDEE